MCRGLLIVSIVCLGAQFVGAQARLSGAGQCAKPDQANRIDVPDRPNHSFAIAHLTCSWTKAFQIRGVEAKGGTAVQFDEISGNASRFHGYFTDTMANGDKAHYRYDGNATLKDGALQSSSWKWTFTGTGKLSSVRGQGTCNGTGRPDGGMTWECQGRYRTAK
jgi:hypothetical protein